MRVLANYECEPERRVELNGHLDDVLEVESNLI